MEHSSFFNSVNGDRKYKASDFAEYFASIIGNGIFAQPSSNLQAMSNNNMTVTVKAGKAWINGYYYSNTSDLILSIDPADGLLSRIDRVVVRLDNVNRSINTMIKKGAPASSPVTPTLQRDVDAYELGIATITINKGAASITQASITDTRLVNTYCGVVHALIEQINLTTLFNQYDTLMAQREQDFEVAFTSWFDTVKDTLNGDIAANLTNRVITAEDSINAMNGAGDIELKANQSDLEICQNSLSEKLAIADFNMYKTDLQNNGLIIKNQSDNTLYYLKFDNVNGIYLQEV